MVDGVLYFTAGFRRDVNAIDAGTVELWTFRLDDGKRGEAAPPEKLRRRRFLFHRELLGELARLAYETVPRDERCRHR